MANLIEELSAQARALLRRTGFDWPRNFLRRCTNQTAKSRRLGTRRFESESPISTLVRRSSFPLKKYLHKFDV